MILLEEVLSGQERRLDPEGLFDRATAVGTKGGVLLPQRIAEGQLTSLSPSK